MGSYSCKNLDLRLAYKYYNVETDYLSGRRKAPFMAKHRGFFNAAYATNKMTKVVSGVSTLH